MAASPIRLVLDRLPVAGCQRVELSVAAYRAAFEAGPSPDEPPSPSNDGPRSDRTD